MRLQFLKSHAQRGLVYELHRLLIGTRVTSKVEKISENSVTCWIWEDRLQKIELLWHLCGLHCTLSIIFAPRTLESTGRNFALVRKPHLSLRKPNLEVVHNYVWPLASFYPENIWKIQQVAAGTRTGANYGQNCDVNSAITLLYLSDLAGLRTLQRISTLLSITLPLSKSSSRIIWLLNKEQAVAFVILFLFKF